MKKYLSIPTISICATLFVLGVVVGQNIYNSRSDVLLSHEIGSNAVLTHIILAFALAGTIVVSIFYHKFAPKKPYIIWVAPFTKEALQRIKNTVLLANGNSPANIIRAIIVAFLSFISLYYFFRAGMQVLAAGDPNFTINAWGGPGYWGASLAHWMDAVILFYVQAFVINMLALRPKRAKATKAKTKRRK